jgi:hypothetical protein
MGRPDGAHSHGPQGGGLVLAVIAAVVLAGSGAASAIASAVVTLVIIAAAVLTVAVLAAVGLLVWRTRQDGPRRHIAARAIVQLPPGSRLQLSSAHRPAIGPGRELHIHLHGLTPEQLAAIVAQRGAYLEEDQ